MPRRGTSPNQKLKIGGLALLYLLLLTPAWAAPAETILIQGKAVDKINHRPVANARVSGHFRTASTDRQGNYKLSIRLKNNKKFALKIKARGYQAQTQTLEASPKRSYTVNFHLVPGTPNTPLAPAVTASNKAPILSISINPGYWNIGAAATNQVVTMPKANKITVVNNGNSPEVLELRLINPEGWSVASEPAKETYVLSGLFCGLEDQPKENHFNQTAAFEDAITTKAKKATPSTFGYVQSALNGTAVSPGGKRALYLQFKSPTVTQKKNEQHISVIVSCQSY